MGIVIRLHHPAESNAVVIGRTRTAGEALALVRQWRDDNPDAWVEYVAPATRPTAA